jgi:hypothetical protein
MIGHVVVASFGPGSASTMELEDALDATWLALRDDPSVRGALARALGIAEVTVAAMRSPPLRVETARSNMSSGEIAVLIVTWLASDVVCEAFKDMAQDAVKKNIRKLWDDYLLPALRARLPSRRSLGPQVPDADAGDED